MKQRLLSMILLICLGMGAPAAFAQEDPIDTDNDPGWIEYDFDKFVQRNVKARRDFYKQQGKDFDGNVLEELEASDAGGG